MAPSHYAAFVAEVEREVEDDRWNQAALELLESPSLTGIEGLREFLQNAPVSRGRGPTAAAFAEKLARQVFMRLPVA